MIPQVKLRFEVRKRGFLSHLYIKCIILPRQARDKHRENSKKANRLLQQRKAKMTWHQLQLESGQKKGR